MNCSEAKLIRDKIIQDFVTEIENSTNVDSTKILEFPSIEDIMKEYKDTVEFKN